MNTSFRDFAVNIVKTRSVQFIGTTLQKHNTTLNFNFILYSIWFAIEKQGRIRKAGFIKLQESVQSWHERISSALQTLLESTKIMQKRNVEFLTETLEEELQFAIAIEQKLLADALMCDFPLPRSEAQQLADASYNIANYYKVLQMRLDEKTRDALIALLQFVFPNQPTYEVSNHLSYAVTYAKINQSSGAQMVLKVS